ncbi:arginine--tRNA ligase [Helicobacter saguini]|uniref:Arginine--tRNA ligase n=1 Tax=Helicobacter saguini TaxID=1548018 RepID=A0A347VYL9_9HELI|nr:arginine--tRNA ligase [Helicobacter saguini]MWV61150.1 arginine--tRNA ligase [Helicobacter saguini]MWV68181.1 arginine--tRNA ligase [Helicobacter saguini]MWV70355.1 arginine--tRNA ligase [Helicobacter saguini]MWV72257.1 arginine--tRNA ligase [Helicobacter saguini]TLD95302.1 arginine--tRNA ligase [Helicobacter saguini]
MFYEVKAILAGLINEFIESSHVIAKDSTIVSPPLASDSIVPPTIAGDTTFNSPTLAGDVTIVSPPLAGGARGGVKNPNQDSKKDSIESKTRHVKQIKTSTSIDTSPTSQHDDKKDSIESKEILIPENIPLEYPKNKEHGHFATTICFSLAKRLRKNPRDLANALSEFIESKNKDSIFENVEALNGFINLTLSLQFLESKINIALKNPQDYAKPQNLDSKKDSNNAQKILLEFVSANPTGPLHIGHARGAIFGSALTNIAQHLGEKIVCEYYVNDAGAQISMLSLSLYNAAREILNLSTLQGEIYKGEYIKDVAKAAIEHFGVSEFHKQWSEIKENLGTFGKEKMLDEIKRTLKQARIHFDNFVSEKALYKEWDATLSDLQKHNAIEEKDGAIWLKSTLKGDDKDRVLVRNNGEPTYMAGDIIYHRDKFERHFKHYINIWGADHHGYIKRIKASIDFLGYNSANLEVLLAQMVSLLKGGQPYKMSKRAGNFILMQDVLDDIGVDSLRFIFLSKSLDTHLEFDIDDLNKQDSSNPIFYINYANARIHTLLGKSSCTLDSIMNAKICDISTIIAGDSATTPHVIASERSERSNPNSKEDFIKDSNNALAKDLSNLIFNALTLSHILESSYKDRSLHKICEYLKNLAKDFHTFYNAHKILNTPYEKQILKALKFISLTLTTAFSLLGIEIKTKM